MHILRYAQVVLAIMAVALFLHIAFTPKEEAFTELYFTDIEENQTHVNLSFMVKNHESSGTEYSYLISVERHLDTGMRREERARGSFRLERGRNRTFIEDIALDGAPDVNMSISVDLYKDGEIYRVVRKWLGEGVPVYERS